MTNGPARLAWPSALALAFAVFVGMSVVVAGRLPAAALATAQAAGALALAVVLAGRPLAVVRSMEACSRMIACAGGVVGVLGPVAVLATARMSDAPTGSVVVFWVAGGWAALAAISALVIAVRSHRPLTVGLAVAGALVAVAGVAGTLANWERPSSFSPLVQFPAREVAILAAGGLMLAGAAALLRAAGGRRLDGALVCAAASALAVGAVWWAIDGLGRGWASLAEQPVQIVLVALAWGTVCVSLPRVLRSDGPARVGALLVVTPVALSALIWLEQIVGVAGPQPLIAGGVAAGAVTLAAGAFAMWRAAGAAPENRALRSMRIASWLPLLLAAVALFLPAVVARADVNGTAGTFAGSWTLLGWESVAGVSVLALAVLVVALARVGRRSWAALLGLAACAVWPLSLATPMHVLTGWLPPGIEQYYGTEYGSIGFTSTYGPWMIAAAIACAAGFVTLIATDLRRHTRADAA